MRDNSAPTRAPVPNVLVRGRPGIILHQDADETVWGCEAVAWYKNAQKVVKCEGSEPVWTTDYKPGATVPRSGIYRCGIVEKR